MRIIYLSYLLILIAGSVTAQERYRGSIPEALLRPVKGETLHYPADTLIGVMGQGEASDAAFSYANWVAAGLLTGRMNHPALEFINPVLREGYLSKLGSIEPRSYRIGGGREEPDGSTSFIVRFIGKESGIIAEMYVRHVIIYEEKEEEAEEDAVSDDELVDAISEESVAEIDVAELDEENVPSAVQVVSRASWVLEDFIMEEAMSREQEERASLHRLDSVPYERFF